MKNYFERLDPFTLYGWCSEYRGWSFSYYFILLKYLIHEYFKHLHRYNTDKFAFSHALIDFFFFFDSFVHGIQTPTGSHMSNTDTGHINWSSLVQHTSGMFSTLPVLCHSALHAWVLVCTCVNFSTKWFNNSYYNWGSQFLIMCKDHTIIFLYIFLPE